MIFSKRLFLPLFIVFFGGAIQSLAQEKCGTVEYEKIRRKLKPNLENTDQFEKWMQNKVRQLKLQALNTNRVQSLSYTIPVVVHIIHNGEAIGTGTNIPDSQVNSQIDVLNEDYPRLNADAVNTPVEFQSVAEGIDITFVLAKQDPEGLPTTGINRVQGTKSSWTMNDDKTFKALSYWPAENYLNLWVINLNDQGIIAYAHLPVSTLPGLEDASNDPLTDGVALDYRAFGTGNPNLYPDFDLGRTAVHEIGHTLGLRHIWGDVSSCSGTDFVADTPTQLGSTSGCPVQPTLQCGHDIMFQNYMDYTNDVCYNLFTHDQVDRMVVVLANSPRRLSLLSSPGGTAPVTVANDLGIRSVNPADISACPSFTPSVEIRNYGNNSITSGRIQLSVNGVTAETKDFILSLAPLDITVATFSTLSLTPGSTNTFVFTVLQTNGGADGKSSNDSFTQTAIVSELGTLPLFEPFASTPASWRIVNGDGLLTWENHSAPNSSSTNKAMYVNFYDYQERLEDDLLISPVFDFSSDTVATLTFDRAYAMYSVNEHDRLRVLVSTDCDFNNATEIFNKTGSALATVPPTTDAFVPNSGSDWKTETISLSQFLGQPNVQIAFIATNDYGNNLYLDNVRIFTGNFADLKLVGLKSPSPVVCVNNPEPIITVRNSSSQLITALTVKTIVGTAAAKFKSFTGLDIDTGEEIDLTLDSWDLEDGNNEITITIQNVDDITPEDNTLNLNVVLNTEEDVIPIREDFENSFSDWTIVSEDQQMEWEPVTTNCKKTSLRYNAYDNLVLGEKSWVVSPVLDFSKTAKAGLFFDLSYAYAQSKGRKERLQILASTDCGLTFPTVLFDKTGENFENSTTTSEWTPGKQSSDCDDDWKRRFINLDDLVGNGQVRIAFVVTNDNGNNLYLDNIEIFTDDDQNPPAIEDTYLIYYQEDKTDPKITFNLPNKGDARVQVYDALGQLVSDEQLPNTLNQTYEFNLGGKPGVYIVKIQTPTKISTTKVFIPN